ncbi:antA/AntB antirepressor family protein [Hafnia alvei]|uniref:antA/AntB antirepressor family protein n=1 Tax=Hafnia alvei TaxID=569 RepID=UPI000B69B2E9|nr:antA/AntB antirepressor family protein [Hafnia alvei]MBI0276745.1 antA/AntB antirepressor family protein [Hafnia alvei]PNK99794.1 antA/AntB antirepressor family protein [Hafnia alvei]
MRNRPSSVLAGGETFANLIPVSVGVINKVETTVVNARALHVALGVGRVFSSWFNDRVARYGFIQGVDFEQLTPERVEITAAGRPEIDYVISVNMAKELAMVERSMQGRSIRNYFIRCEEELHRIAPVKLAALRKQLKEQITAANHHREMCAALELHRHELGKETASRHYATESNMLYRILLGGLTAKRWAAHNGFSGNPRDHMNAEQLEHLSYLEKTNTTLIEMGKEYHERKQSLILLSQKRLARQTLTVTASAEVK